MPPMAHQFSRRQFASTSAALGFYALTARRAGSATAETHSIRIDPASSLGIIRPQLHSHFSEHLGSCTYGGLWVGPNSKISNIHGYRREAIEYLKALGIPVLRWPGGCFADDYHWRDGIGSADKRPKTVNIHWGDYVEDNSFGTHEFVGLCRLIGAEPYFAGNVGSGTPEELRDWVEYCNYPSGSRLSDERAANGSPEPFRVKYWGIGNENWGCGGQMRPEEYSGYYRRFANFVRPFGGTVPFPIACGPNRNNKDWTEKFFEAMPPGRRNIAGYSMHYYSNGPLPATRYTPEAMQQQFESFARLEQAIADQREILDRFDPQHRIGLIVDEWGVWDRMVPEEQQKYGHLWQQNTIRCGIAAALGLNLFHRNAAKLYMCNIAQIVNVLQSVLLTDGDRCIRTPTYYAFELLKPHRGKTAVKVENDERSSVGLSISASRRNGELILTLVNPRPDAAMNVACSVAGKSVSAATARILHHADLNACNTFDRPDEVVPKDYTATASGSGMRVDLPPLSVVTVQARLS